MTANDNKSDRQAAGLRTRATGPARSAASRAANAYDPFCSKRCADVDLHRWLKGSYVIPGANAEPEPDDEEA